jgi:CHAD domain-containing protein
VTILGLSGLGERNASPWPPLPDSTAALRLPTRVAARRLRSTLRIFADDFDPDRAGAFDAELSWYAALLGEVRDREAQRARFTQAIAALPEELVMGPVAARIEQHLLAAQLQHRAARDKTVNGRRYHALLRDSARWVTDPPFTDLAAGKATELRSAVRAAAKKVTKHLNAGLGPHGDDEGLHEARKAGKPCPVRTGCYRPTAPTTCSTPRCAAR